MLIHALASSVLSVVACLIYRKIYTSTFETDFSAVLNVAGIISASVLGCTIMALGYAILEKLNKQKLIGVFNILIAGLSLASVIGPIAITLPLDLESPELFPAYAIPMHFFPVLAFFTLVPFIDKRRL